MNWRTILFWLHLVSGCLAGIVILVMSATGVLLTYERQIVSWANRDLHSRPPINGAARLAPDSIVAPVAAQKRALPSAVTLYSHPLAPAEVSFGRDTVFLVDVYTGGVLGQSSPATRSFFEKVENVHRWLGVSAGNRATGRAVTGACNFAFLTLVVSGPFLWMPRRWSWKNVKSVALFRGGLSGRARDYNWHNVIGIWSTVPLFVIVLSGVVMSYPWANNLLYRVTGSEQPPAQGNRQRPESNPGGRQGGERREVSPALNPLWSRAEQQVAGWQSLTLRLPPGGRGPMTFTISAGNPGRPDLRSQLTLNPRTAEVIRWEPFASYNAGRRLRGWFRFLHTGEAGGFAGQTVAGAASLGAVVLVWTGLCLACRRLFRWRKRNRDSQEALEQKQPVAAGV